jgi:hypothetical protein
VTNTLHRWSEHYAGRGDQAPPVQDDFIVFAMATRNVNDDDLVEKYRAFAKLALKHNPVNVGDGTKGGLYRPQRGPTPLAHWRRDQRPDPDRLISDIEGFTTMAAVFRTFEDMEGFVGDLKEAELGVSVNISAPMDDARRCCRSVGIFPHSVEYSLGFMGRLDRLPDGRVLEIGTMCGHGMISHNLVRKLMDRVREGRRTSGEAARCLARFCICGVFNLARAEKIFEGVKTGKP